MPSRKKPISETAKENIKEVVGAPQGAYENVTIIPEVSKRETRFNEIVDTLKAGKFFVLRAGYSRNSVYVLLRNLKEKANIEACFSKTEIEEGVRQFAVFVTKTPEKKKD